MPTNVGTVDRVIRIVAGLALLVWTAFLNGPVWSWIGVLQIRSAYSVLGINTCGT